MPGLSAPDSGCELDAATLDTVHKQQYFSYLQMVPGVHDC